MAKGDNGSGNGIAVEVALERFWPPYMIDLFASQRTLVVGQSYDGAGTVSALTATALGVVAEFKAGERVRRMLLSAHGWGWLA